MLSSFIPVMTGAPLGDVSCLFFLLYLVFMLIANWNILDKATLLLIAIMGLLGVEYSSLSFIWDSDVVSGVVKISQIKNFSWELIEAVYFAILSLCLTHIYRYNLKKSITDSTNFVDLLAHIKSSAMPLQEKLELLGKVLEGSIRTTVIKTINIRAESIAGVATKVSWTIIIVSLLVLTSIQFNIGLRG